MFKGIDTKTDLMVKFLKIKKATRWSGFLRTGRDSNPSPKQPLNQYITSSSVKTP